MSPGRARSGPRPKRTAPNEPVRALTSDVWYTLLYLHAPDQVRLDLARVRIWSSPLVRAGRSRTEAITAVRALESWAAAAEAEGWTPTIPVQAEHLTERTGVPMDPVAIADRLDALVDRFPIRVAPGAIASLARLHEAGLRLGLVSNLLHETGEGLRRLLSQVGLLPFFSCAILSSEHPWSKPRPEPFRAAVRALGRRPGEAAHVGDLTYDVLGARRAGLWPILYTGLHRYEPARLDGLTRITDRNLKRVARWADLPDLLIHRH